MDILLVPDATYEHLVSACGLHRFAFIVLSRHTGAEQRPCI